LGAGFTGSPPETSQFGSDSGTPDLDQVVPEAKKSSTA
jgi:hypothetical protein